MQSNDLWRGTIQIQRSGGFDYDLQTAEEEILSMFGDGSQGAWFDPADMSTLFQDAAGTTPVTALEQPVGLMLDKSGRGNHVSQAVAASRPVLSARVNMLPSTDMSVSYVFVGGTRLPGLPNYQGQLTAVRFSGPSTGPSTMSLVAPAASIAFEIDVLVEPGNSTSLSFLIRNSTTATNLGSGSFPVATGVVAGAITSKDLGNNWRRVRIEQTTGISKGDGLVVYFGATSAVASGFNWVVDRPQLVAGMAVVPFQAIRSAADYDTAGFPVYLLFDGANDCLFTSGNVDLSGTNKMSLISGVGKLNDASDGVLAGLSGSSANNGSFELSAPGSSGAARLQFSSKGTLQVVPFTSSAAFSAPVSAVVTCVSDIAAPIALLRANGAQLHALTATQGGGRFGSYPLFIGRRNNAALPFNGNLHGVLLIGRLLSASELAAAEGFMAARAGVTL